MNEHFLSAPRGHCMSLSFNTKNRLKGETLHESSSWCQPGEHPPTLHQDVRNNFSVLAHTQFSLIYIYHIRWRYLGVARPTETKSVRQTGLKLSKYLHIFIMIFNIHNILFSTIKILNSPRNDMFIYRGRPRLLQFFDDF